MSKYLKVFMAGVFVIVFILLLVSHITAQDNKWVTYHGDFASFLVKDDFELDYENKGGSIKYIIKFAENPEYMLIIENGISQMNYKIASKKGYKLDTQNALFQQGKGLEKSGTTPQGNRFREIFLYYTTAGEKVPQRSLVYVAYDNVPSELADHFDTIIDSIKLKNVYEEPLPFPQN
ncbi:MAG: hypothetical protein ACLFQV_13205 [Vulcanimicrobiota bacterium]